MSIKQLHPYIHLDGTAKQAIALYERVLGAKVEQTIPYEKEPEKLLHASLRIGAAVLMLNDAPPGMPAIGQTFINIALDMDDVADSTSRFDAMASGGKVLMPLHDTFYGAKLGVVEDAFGVRWMFNISK